MQVAVLWYSGAAFGPRIPSFSGYKQANQQYNLLLFTKLLINIFPRFWIKRPSTFESTQFFSSHGGLLLIIIILLGMLHPLCFQILKDHKILDVCAKFLFSDFYLSLLFKFKIRSSLKPFLSHVVKVCYDINYSQN